MIYIASDHAGFKLKQKLLKKYDFLDLGPNKFNKKDDYPDYAKKLAIKVVKEKTRGILICDTGQGVNIVANKIKGVYSALCYDIKTAKHAKEHLNANIICLGAKFLDDKKAKEIIDIWLKSKFKKGRHLRRLKKI